MARTAITLLPGMSIEITCPMDAANSYGFFPLAITEGTLEGVTLINGFSVVSSEIGTLEPGTTGNKVKYIHKKPMNNTIYFYALTGEVGAVDIINIPVHDHSSIVFGGPAFGTYFNDDETSNS